MSSLTQNLSTIYGIKNQIKEVIGTQSDLFEDYPDLISAAIAGGGEGLDWDDVATAGYIIPAGTLNVSANGSSIDVASYAYANVQVSGGSSPSGTLSYDLDPDAGYPIDVDVASYEYISLDLNSATVEITSNGNYNTFHDFSYDFVTGINVNVPIPAGYIQPSGSITISANASSIDVSTYQYADVEVPAPVYGTLYATENGVYDPQNLGYDGYDSVTVDVPISGGTVTESGNYAFFMFIDGINPYGTSLQIASTDFYDDTYGTIWQSANVYCGIYRIEEYTDPATSQLSYCNSYYSVEIRDSNNQLVNTLSVTSYDCGNPYAIYMYGNMAASTSLYFHLYWNHGEVTADEMDPNMMVANWTSEDLGVIGFDGLPVSRGSNHIVITCTQTNTQSEHIEGEIEEAKLWKLNAGYQLVDEWQAESE